jgi:hypothetical protein
MITTNDTRPTVGRRYRKLFVSVAGLAALSVGTLGFAAGAGAAGVVPHALTPKAIEAAGSSSYLAGYQVTPAGGLASASDTFTVPKITCTAKDKSQSAIQWDGVYTDTLNTFALVATECLTSGPTYQYVFQTEAGSFVEPGAAPGDTVVTSLFQSGSSTWAEIHDLTANLYWFADNPVNQGDTVVDIGTLNGTFEGRPVPTYTTATLSNATVNGDYLGFDSPTQFNALNGGDLIAKAGKLKTNGSGSSFTVTFEHAT